MDYKVRGIQFIISALLMTLVLGCQDKPESIEPPVRGLKTIEITDTGNTMARRYPSVLQPSDSAALSFEISGKMSQHNISVGQRVQKGEVLFSLDRRSLEIAVDQARAVLDQAQATAANAKSDLKRQKALFQKRIVSEANLEQAETVDRTSSAKVRQSKKQLEIALQDLAKSTIKAPYDGIVKSVEAESFMTVSAGEAIATLYRPDNFEVKFSVSYDIVSRIELGKDVSIRLADSPDIVLAAKISELGASADTVSSYPVIAKLVDANSALKNGMAIEVVLNIKVSEGAGYALPTSAFIVDGDLSVEDYHKREIEGEVFVFDEESKTVQRTLVTMVGLRDNQIIVSGGLKVGDRVAVAGVPFLHEGQKVKLLDDSSALRGK